MNWDWGRDDRKKLNLPKHLPGGATPSKHPWVLSLFTPPSSHTLLIHTVTSFLHSVRCSRRKPAKRLKNAGYRSTVAPYPACITHPPGQRPRAISSSTSKTYTHKRTHGRKTPGYSTLDLTTHMYKRTHGREASPVVRLFFTGRPSPPYSSPMSSAERFTATLKALHGWREQRTDLKSTGLQAIHPRLHLLSDPERPDSCWCSREEEIARLEREELDVDVGQDSGMDGSMDRCPAG